MLQLDPTTQASLEAAVTPSARAAAILSSLSGTITVTVRDGAGATKGSGTMTSFGTQSANVIVLNNVTSFTVSETGTPDPTTWTIEFANAGGRFVKGTFGLYTSPIAEFKWSLDSWENGQSGTIASAYCTVRKNEVLSDATDTFEVVPAPVNTAPVWLLSRPTSLSGTAGSVLQLAQYAYDPDGESLTYSISSYIPPGYSINPSTGALTIGTTTQPITIRVTDSGGLSADWPVTVTVTVSGIGSVVTTSDLQAAGYVVVTAAPYNADPTGNIDATSALQAAIDYGYANGRPVWIPSGTYLVSNTLRCYEWQYAGKTPESEWHDIQGAAYPSRPVIKLANNTPAFASQSTPRPVIHIQLWSSPTQTSAPSNRLTFNPYSGPGGDWYVRTPNNFDNCLWGVEVDTGSGNPGADGISFNSAQNAFFGKCKVDATGSNVGIANFPGQSSVSMDIEVVGGRLGVEVSGSQGCCVVGLRVTGDAATEHCLRQSTQAPATIAGFVLSKPTAGSVVELADSSSTSAAAVAMVDGSISVNGGIAFENENSRSIYLRNMYVTGTDSLVKSGTASTLVGTGTVKLVTEYSCTNPDGTEKVAGSPLVAEESALKHFSFIDGVRSSALERVKSATSMSSVPANIWTQHVPTVERIDSGQYIDVSKAPYLATPDGSSEGPDVLAKLHQAFLDAETAGHNRVFLPRGTWRVSNTLTLRANTKLFGVGHKHTRIQPRSSWSVTSGNPILIDTVSDATGTASLDFIGTNLAAVSANTIRHTHVRWRVGRNSHIWCTYHDVDYISPYQPFPERSMLIFEGTAGGRHYGFHRDGRAFNGAGTRVYTISGTSEPLHIYGNQVEISKNISDGIGEDGVPCRTNIEVINSSNIRFYHAKREGDSGTLWVHGVSDNIAWYGASAMRGPCDPGAGHYYEFGEDTTNVLVAIGLVQSVGSSGTTSATKYTLQESGNVGSATLIWPNGVSLYKRGTIDDSRVAI